MALQVQLNTTSGIQLPGAYVKIVAFSGDLTNTYINYKVFADAQARLDGKVPVETDYAVVASPTGLIGKNIIEWCYTQTKLLPKFINSSDV